MEQIKAQLKAAAYRVTTSWLFSVAAFAFALATKTWPGIVLVAFTLSVYLVEKLLSPRLKADEDALKGTIKALEDRVGRLELRAGMRQD